MPCIFFPGIILVLGLKRPMKLMGIGRFDGKEPKSVDERFRKKQGSASCMHLPPFECNENNEGFSCLMLIGFYFPSNFTYDYEHPGFLLRGTRRRTSLDKELEHLDVN